MLASDILPLILLTGTFGAVHPLTRFPGVTILSKPTRRRILDSAIRGALDTRYRVLKLQTQAREIEERNLSLRSMSEELAGRNLALAEALRTRESFLATMSHELRTPLNAILSYADLLDLEIDGPLSEGQRRHLNRVTLSAHHLLELISEILDLAKLTAGKIELHVSPLDFPAEVEAAATLFWPQAREKGLDLTIDQPSEPLPLVLGDSLRVRQVLLNLLSNAIKFTSQGGVTIGFRRRDDGAVSVLVQDTGIGLSPEERSKLFTDFFQADSGLARTHDGAGLGLAISKRLTLLMEGDLSAESELGRGSVFTLTLPPAPPSPPRHSIRA
jgi:signal transduction histidine kinase